MSSPEPEDGSIVLVVPAAYAFITDEVPGPKPDMTRARDKSIDPADLAIFLFVMGIPPYQNW